VTLTRYGHTCFQIKNHRLPKKTIIIPCSALNLDLRAPQMRWEMTCATALFKELEAQAGGEHLYAMPHVLLF
jgi:hypothetical protein